MNFWNNTIIEIERSTIDIITKLTSFTQKHYRFLLYLILLSVCSFAFELFHLILTVDEELAIASNTSNIAWVQQGRWGLYLVTFLFLPNPIVPFLPLFTGLVFSAMSYVLIIKTFTDRITLASYIAAPLVLTTTTLYFAYHFNTINFAFGIGFFLCALAFYLLVKTSSPLKYISVLLFAFAIGIYQAFVPWVCTLIFLYLLNQILQKGEEFTFRKLLIDGIYYFGILVVSLISYYILAKLSYIVFNTTPNHHVNQYVNSSELTDWGYWSKTLSSLWGWMKSYYFGTKQIYLYPIIGLGALVVVNMVFLAYKAIRSKSALLMKGIAIFLILLIPVVPFMINFISGGTMPTRVTLGFPLVLGMMTFFTIQKSQGLLKVIVVSLSIICAFQFASRNNQFAYMNYLSWEADRDLAVRVISKVEDIHHKLAKKKKRYPMVVMGKPRLNRTLPYFRKNYKETIGWSFWEMGEGKQKNIRIFKFLQILGIERYRNGYDKAQKVTIKEEIKKMPKWPDKGSVDVIEGLIVVKF